MGTAARLFLAWPHYHSDTAGCLAASCRRPPPPARPQARPASHEPLRPPAPSPGQRAAAARRPRAVWGTKASGLEKPRLAEAPVFPSRAHEVGKGAQGRAQARLPPAAGFSLLDPPPAPCPVRPPCWRVGSRRPPAAQRLGVPGRAAQVRGWGRGRGGPSRWRGCDISTLPPAWPC